MVTKELMDKVMDSLANLGTCDEHKPKVDPVVVGFDDVIRYRRWCGCHLPDNRTCDTYCDHSSAGLLRLKDGRVFVFWEWSDTTGHG